MNLARALRLDASQATHQVISFAGAGGKTTALFQLARQLSSHRPVIVTATSHLGVWQIPLADHHIIAEETLELPLPSNGVVLVTGGIEGERTKPVQPAILERLHAVTKAQGILLLVEADGSRQKPLKAPADHEPPIPPFSDSVVYLAGLRALGTALHEDNIHRPEHFAALSGLSVGQIITPQALSRALTHPNGGMKNIPPHARRVALLNQADTPELQALGGRMAPDLLHTFDSVIIAALEQDNLHTIERTAGVILAAGKSSRYGAPKQLLDWHGKPFIRQVAETALQARLNPVVVVTGFRHAEVESAIADLPVQIAFNPEYEAGQSTSLRAGLHALSNSIGAAVFLLADQPQIPVEVIRALVELHTHELAPIVAPLVLEERRANPVLFDKVAFDDLLRVTGDTGGRAVFDKHRVQYLPWHDDMLLFDVDKPEDYERLKGAS